MLDLRGIDDALREELRRERLQRFIGVIYRPDTELQSHYFQARVTEQFDALIHVDRSTALVPLEPSSHWWHEEVPETYPTGL